MRRDQLEHLIRAAGAITGSRRLVVIGSQAILGQFPHGAPVRATLSMEADLLPIDAPAMSDMLTGSLGELSPFHDTFGYFADGVSLHTAILPPGWDERLVPIDNANTSGYIGLCLEVHDLLISKYLAGREKDRDFCAAVAGAGLVGREMLLERLASMPLEAGQAERVARWINSDCTKATPSPGSTS